MTNSIKFLVAVCASTSDNLPLYFTLMLLTIDSYNSSLLLLSWLICECCLYAVVGSNPTRVAN
ncbi:hypothetical protein [Candidatus Tisiphia endosymbiont of Dascillus cervinus]|uniref:hypothetical protein n=1 Tax=Candidatus Tisiphia endosymbiont of Dascillus cervinus TaxID=3066253 RepID=UPI00312C955C